MLWNIKVLWNIQILRFSFFFEIFCIFEPSVGNIFFLCLSPLVKAGLEKGSNDHAYRNPCARADITNYFTNLEAWNNRNLCSNSVEARSLTSSCQQGQGPTEGSTESPSCFFQLLVAPGVPRVVAEPLQSAFVFTWLLLLSVSLRTLG